ncbi:MAG: insulinase family protein [Planctomycetaceae bacterium]|jgi:predicted Zn-dependent peptidase|nr:insulinase family protein [Planctomycetaceae bacterium]
MVFIHRFDNGLILLADSVDWAESVSYVFSIPFGSVFDPVGLEGLATLVCEMISRGAGGRGNREFLEAFENLGCVFAESVGLFDTCFCVSMLPENLFSAIELTADQVLRPHFEERYLEPVKQKFIQEIHSLDDEPSRRMMLELQRNFLPDPLGRSGLGTVKTVNNIAIEDIRRVHNLLFQPDGAVFSIAGKFDFDQVCNKIGELFANWQPNSFVLPQERIIGKTEIYIAEDSEQTHIGVAYPSIPIGQRDYKLALCSVGVISGGSSCRLFRELRENRGLCYSVAASYVALRNRANVYCYCGTSTDKAQEALDVLIAELERLRYGVGQDEINRYKICSRSELVIGQESIGERCGDMLFEWQHLKHIRSLSEIESSINSLTKSDVDAFLASNPAGPFHIAVLGPKPLKIPKP